MISSASRRIVSHGALHVGVAAHQRGMRIWLGLAHGANHGKTITWV